MVYRKLNTAAFHHHGAAATLLIAFAFFAGQLRDCQPCFAGDAQGDSASSELVVIVPISKPSSCSQDSTVSIAAPSEKCAVADAMRLVTDENNEENSISPTSGRTATRSTLSASSCSAVGHKNALSQFVAAIRLRANHADETPPNPDSTGLTAPHLTSTVDNSLAGVDRVVAPAADPLRSKTSGRLPIEAIAESAGEIFEGSHAEEFTSENYFSILSNLSKPRAMQQSGGDIQTVAAEELLSAPEPTELPVEPNARPLQGQEIEGTEPPSHDWISGNSDVNFDIINNLGIELGPLARGKSHSREDDEIYTGELPENFAAQKLGLYANAPSVGVGGRRSETGNFVLWAAPKFHHRPLYFEQPNLERYGHHVGGQCIQSAVSAAHFFGSIPLLPYKMGSNPPRSCNYTLGRYRPGNCNPTRVEVPEFSPRGFLYQGMFTTGAVLIVP